MRLGSRVLFELATVFVVGAGLVKGVQLGWSQGQRWFSGGQEAAAAIVPEPVPLPVPAPAPRAPAAIAEQPPLPPEIPTVRETYDPAHPPGPDADTFTAGTFHGVADEVLLAPLRAGAEITRVKFNRGGSTISLRLDFANGARAAFKPEQTNPATTPRKEVAAYRLNRMLGLNAVPPATPILLSKKALFAAWDKESRAFIPRVKAEVIWSKSDVKGELSWWVPEIVQGTFRGQRLDHDAGAVLWGPALSARRKIAPREKAMLGQISSMIAFDFLTDNTDRFSGGNALMSPDRSKLYYMDNGMSFSDNYPRSHRKLRRFLGRVQRFSRQMVDRVRKLTREEIAAEMSRDLGPYGSSLLKPAELAALLERRAFLLTHVDEMIAKFGENEVLYFP